jgi:hypothetical protein
MIKHFQQFEVSTLEFEKVSLGKESVILPRVNSSDCPLFQLPSVELTCYGMPKPSKYFPTDKDRMFIQIPIQGELLDKFKELDEHMNSMNSRVRLASQSLYNHTYQPIIKEGIRGPYIKLKLQTDYETGNIETIILKDGEIMTDTETMIGFEKHIKLKSSLKTIIKLSKVWAMNKKYGLTFKLIRVAVDEPKQETINLNSLDFLD